MKIFKQYIKLGVFSLMIFLSISFISFMFNFIGTYETQWDIKVGFPLVFYNEFYKQGNCFPNFGWKINYFIFDFIFTFLMVILGYKLWNKFERN